VTRSIRSANAEFQVLSALATNRQTRNRENAFLVQGVRNIDAAIEHGWTVRAVLTAGTRSAWAERVIAGVDDVVELAPSLFDELAEREDRPEVLLVVEKRRVTLERVNVATVLDRPSSPGNIGTIIRTADALGGDAVLVMGHGADPYDPRAIRASTGSFFAVPVAEIENVDALKALGASLVATDEGGDTPLDQLPSGPLALLFGNETAGLSRALRERADRTVAIPMHGSASSLNIAAAHAIVLFAATHRS
jgi:23S rRNA (uridine2479-2'-O)-methyltransferase